MAKVLYTELYMQTTCKLHRESVCIHLCANPVFQHKNRTNSTSWLCFKNKNLDHKQALPHLTTKVNEVYRNKMKYNKIGVCMVHLTVKANCSDGFLLTVYVPDQTLWKL